MSTKYIIHTHDSDGTEVLLGELEWKEQILKRHPEIEPYLDEIIDTVNNPHERQIDSEDVRIYLNYYKISKSKQIHKKLKYLLVIVKYVNAPERNFERTGFISSVYFVRQIKKRGV